MSHYFQIVQLRQPTPAHVAALADLLIDCVEDGASVSFMTPLTPERAKAFWDHVAQETAAGRRILLVAKDKQGICGSVQLILNLPENQPHRADLAKMLVHTRARRMGIGMDLLQSAEKAALDAGKKLLVLDAVTDGPAYHLYQKNGWTRVGDIPNFALYPHYPTGGFCSTTYFYKQLAPLP